MPKYTVQYKLVFYGEATVEAKDEEDIENALGNLGEKALLADAELEEVEVEDYAEEDEDDDG